VGEIEKDDKVLVIRRIGVTYFLKGVEAQHREVVERVLGFHQDRCPVARTIGGCVDISSSVEYVA
jgi:uncharacterized OsmC-like protein